ncbi:MAG: oxygenase MpaB family protein [Spirosomataceae bacterium]|jgi:hypothetical protein
MLWILLLILVVVSLLYSLWYFSLRKNAAPSVKIKEELSVRRWDLDFLESKRKHTDPLADNVIEQIMTKGELEIVNKLFRAINETAEEIPDHLPAEVKKYFLETEKLPDWADPKLIEMGQEVYARNGVYVGMLLSFKSLPECYSGAKGANVLHHTGRLNHSHGAQNAFARRIAETAQFVILAMSPGGLDPQGKGIRAAQKVRLIHAVIRYYLRKHQWDADAFGEPINQEDMAGTLMSFSALILEGLELLDVELSHDEKEAYIHTWRVVGHFMGVDPELLPNNAADALALGHAIIDHQKGESEQGKSLMKALIEFNENSFPIKMHPNTLYKMYRYLIGEELAGYLGIPKVEKDDLEDFAEDFREIVGTISDISQNAMLALMMKGIGKIMLTAMINFMDENQKINFYIPESLQKDWGLNN